MELPPLVGPPAAPGEAAEAEAPAPQMPPGLGPDASVWLVAEARGKCESGVLADARDSGVVPDAPAD
eukprot:11207285-Lingulodinium_polyedra.AAC.1